MKKILFFKTSLILAIIILNFNFLKFKGITLNAFLLLKLILLIVLILCSLKLVFIIFRNKKSNLLLSIISISLTFSFLELIFTFIPRSHHAEESYASIIWHNYYYKINSHGFRDEVEKNKALPGIVFMGDSYTAGYGIKNESQRFSNIVGDSLLSKYEFYNLGLKGTGLKTHLEILDTIHGQKEILVYQILINDLDDYCSRVAPIYNIYSVFSNHDYIIAKSSFLLNYLYFNFPNKKIEEDYFTFFKNCYSKEDVFNNYIKDLKKFINKAKNEKGFSDIIIVIVPTLNNLDWSQKFDLSVLHSVKLNVFYPVEEIKSIEVKNRIINKQDSHPSEIIHKLIANHIIEQINNEN